MFFVCFFSIYGTGNELSIMNTFLLGHLWLKNKVFDWGCWLVIFLPIPVVMYCVTVCSTAWDEHPDVRGPEALHPPGEPGAVGGGAGQAPPLPPPRHQRGGHHGRGLHRQPGRPGVCRPRLHHGHPLRVRTGGGAEPVTNRKRKDLNPQSLPTSADFFSIVINRYRRYQWIEIW